MKFLADENIPLDVVHKLKSKSINIISVANISRGIKDEEVLSIANKEKRVLITFDRDFGEMIFRLKNKSHGVIMLRIHPQSAGHIASTLEKVIAAKIEFHSSFCVVEANRIRVIPLSI